MEDKHHRKIRDLLEGHAGEAVEGVHQRQKGRKTTTILIRRDSTLCGRKNRKSGKPFKIGGIRAIWTQSPRSYVGAWMPSMEMII